MIDKMIKGKSKFCNLIFGKIVPFFGIPKIWKSKKVENFGIPTIWFLEKYYQFLEWQKSKFQKIPENSKRYKRYKRYNWIFELEWTVSTLPIHFSCVKLYTTQ